MFKKGNKAAAATLGRGRPLTQALISQLNEMAVEKGRKTATPKMHKLVARLIQLGIEDGDMIAIKEIFNRVEGRVIQAHELTTGNEENAFIIRISSDDEKV